LIDDAQSVGDFSGALVALSEDSALRARMRAASLQAARAFNWDAILDRLLEDYRDVMNRSEA
jgi:glycosyltransferase involved in cell wall biosynthesis